MNSLKVLSFFLLTIGLVNADCSMTTQDADNCAADIMLFGNRKLNFPSNDAQLDKFCSDTKKSVKCLQTHSATCLKGMAQAISQGILTKIDESISGRCNNKDERVSFFENTKCFVTKANQLEPIHQCGEKHIIMSEKIVEFPRSDRMAAMCCSTHYILKCFKDTIVSLCGQDVLDYIKSLYSDSDEDALAMQCGEFGTLEACDKSMNKDQWKILIDLANSDDASVLAQRHKYKSVVAPLIEILSKA